MTQQMKAKMGQVFICACCSKAFTDRAATQPVGVEMEDVVVGVAARKPNEYYPDDDRLATTVYEDTPGQTVDIPEALAGECCATHTVLCNANRIRFRQNIDGTVEIVGAEHLE